VGMSRTTVEPATDNGSDRRQARIRDLWPYLRMHRRTLAIVAALSLVSAAASLAVPLLVRTMLDGLGTGENITALIVVLAVLMITGAVIGAVSQFLLERTAEAVVRTTRDRLSSHLLRLPIREYDHRSTGDLLSRVGSDTTLVSAVVTSGLVDMASGVVVAGGAIVLMALIDVPLLLVTVTAVGVGIGIAATATRRIRVYSRQAQDAVGAMTAAMERALVSVRTIRAYRAEPGQTEVLADHAGDAYGAGVKVARVSAFILPVVNVAVQAAFLSVLGIGGASVATGRIGVGDLVAFVMLLFLLIQPTVSGLRALTTVMTGLGALGRIEDVLQLPAESDGHRATPAPAVPTRSARKSLDVPELSFVNVDFEYSPSQPVLTDVSFTCPAGGMTAIVGPSGAGKSTIMALIERFYDVDAGRILLAGQDITNIPHVELRRQIGYVEQEAPVLAGTVRENLQLGDPTATDTTMQQALESVNLWHRVAAEPAGLDAQVGDAGVLLSGGERQRLAIARALLAAAPLLLLDEPTASLDARNEAALQQAVSAASDERTLIVVAHRLSTVVRADRIVVLDGGRVLAYGTHAELLDSSPLYRELAATQLLV
jgi:ABC-type multidrug transport system fused ATPase/permease subunit